MILPCLSVAVQKSASFMPRVRHADFEPKPHEHNRFAGVLSIPKFENVGPKNATHFGIGTLAGYPIRRPHIGVDRARVFTVAIRPSPTRVIGWTSNTEVEMVKVLGRHSIKCQAMDLAMHVVDRMAATGCHGRSCECD
jgi:hypothetical protein